MDISYIFNYIYVTIQDPLPLYSCIPVFLGQGNSSRLQDFMESVIKLWNRLHRELMDSLSLEVFKRHEMWHLETWFRGGFSSVGLTAALDDLRSLSQHKQSYYSIIMYNKSQKFTAEVSRLSHHKTVTELTISSRRRMILNIWKEQEFLLLVSPSVRSQKINFCVFFNLFF